MIHSDVDTIAAIATPAGEGGLAVIRVSGPRSVELTAERFSGRTPLLTAATHTAHFGHFRNSQNELIDEVVVTVFRAPHSYTAEDVVEVSCHGGMCIARTILAELLTAGARPADAGEFTRRAFLNGRIDLAQAEAVADLIHSRSERFHRISLQHLEGDISKEVANLREDLLHISSLLELELDFSEEQLNIMEPSVILKQLDDVSVRVHSMVSSFKLGRVCKEGVRVAIVGRPNVGKSSLFNKMLTYERAIVTDMPGTTRDTIEEDLRFNGLLFRLVDTAGLRATEHLIESAGITRTRTEISNADVILAVTDLNSGVTIDDEECVKALNNIQLNAPIVEK
jgi:tRNA modification GTPase